MSYQRFTGKVAIITGAGQGIGKGIAMRFAREGAKVVVNDIELARATSVAQEIESLGQQAMAIKANVSESAEVRQMVEAVEERFGQIDILVNNAGICKPAFITDLSEEIWDQTIAINLKGTFLCSKTVAEVMIRQRHGRIINMSSKSGKQGGLWLAAYSASKFGIIGLTQSLAMDLAPYGITVNAVCPGVVFTPLWDDLAKAYAKKLKLPEEKVRPYYVEKIPLGRECTPDDVANVVAFLASDEASYLTGQAINVAGGQEMR
ncbi:MAG: sorbitol-6-phosphate dehydrogenase [Firmicutes bacterium]|nr:sorbitol-6-phosphate dehydrogenase [Bacillota bacterium]